MICWEKFNLAKPEVKFANVALGRLNKTKLRLGLIDDDIDSQEHTEVRFSDSFIKMLWTTLYLYITIIISLNRLRPKTGYVVLGAPLNTQ